MSMSIFLEAVAVLIVMATLLGLVPRNEWWFRDCDFPRLQLIALGSGALLIWVVLWHQGTSLPGGKWACALMVGLLCALIFQLSRVLPYSRLWPVQVLQAKTPQPDRTLSLFVSNVLTPNPHKDRLILQIRQYQPDVVITLETDQDWEQALSVLHDDYPHRVAVPLDNLYGMHLYSKLPLINPQILFRLSEDIPSIHTGVRLRCGKVIQLYAVHPKPPSPTEALDSTQRDAELLMVAKEVARHDQTTIVAGDLNDVAWSHTTRLFQKISGLLDPRIGRHFMNTFHADYWFLRWSLDHIFHSTDFSLVRMERVPHIGSDHFPVYTELHFDPVLEAVQEAPEATADDRAEAEERIEEGEEQAAQEATEEAKAEARHKP